jgi:hypothetical protein
MLINLKNKKKIIENTKILSTSYEQGVGLMFSLRKNFNYALIFTRDFESKFGSAIHMFFVFFPICVIFLNSNKEVVDIKKKILPFGFYLPKKPAKYVIEIPIETDISFVNIGDKLKW